MDDADSPLGVTAPRATTISLSVSSVSLNALGATDKIVATVKDQKGAIMTGATVSWTSDDESVAAVNSGLVTAQGNGRAIIFATSGTPPRHPLPSRYSKR